MTVFELTLAGKQMRGLYENEKRTRIAFNGLSGFLFTEFFLLSERLRCLRNFL